MKLGYRSDEEIERWRERDPVELAGAKLEPDVRTAIDGEVDALLDEAVEFARVSPRPNPEDRWSWRTRTAADGAPVRPPRSYADPLGAAGAARGAQASGWRMRYLQALARPLPDEMARDRPVVVCWARTCASRCAG